MDYSTPGYLNNTILVTHRVSTKQKKTGKTIYRNRMDQEQIQI
jgi:hypothetical protein